jgi:hypothetical protein
MSLFKFPVLLAFTGVLFILGVGLSRAGNINRWEGGGLLSAYLFYPITRSLTPIACAIFTAAQTRTLELINKPSKPNTKNIHALLLGIKESCRF